jgi:ATP-dependent Zn protease
MTVSAKQSRWRVALHEVGHVVAAAALSGSRDLAKAVIRNARGSQCHHGGQP